MSVFFSIEIFSRRRSVAEFGEIAIDIYLYGWLVSVDRVTRDFQEMFMSGSQSPVRRNVRESVAELRKHGGIFSFENSSGPVRLHQANEDWPDLYLRPGAIVECVVRAPGSGAITSALQVLAKSSYAHGVWSIVDDTRDFYLPALSGWGINARDTLVLRPQTVQETCWSIEQCLRSTGVAVTLARIERKLPARIHRRWQLAAEKGGGIGLFFRPEWARKEPIWADSRLLVTPQAGGPKEKRRLQIEVLYRRGGLGQGAQAWEIDHAAGLVRLVS
jgi:hypothetical protein